MKISVNVDCTPAEARVFLGLPDVSPVNDLIVAAMLERAKDNIDALSDPTQMWERAMTASSTGMEAMTTLFQSAMAGQKAGD